MKSDGGKNAPLPRVHEVLHALLGEEDRLARAWQEDDSPLPTDDAHRRGIVALLPLERTLKRPDKNMKIAGVGVEGEDQEGGGEKKKKCDNVLSPRE